MLPMGARAGLRIYHWRFRVLAFALLSVAIEAMAQPPGPVAPDLDRTVRFHIAAQPLDGALLEFSKQANVPVAVNARGLNAMQAPALQGPMAVRAALDRLLRQTVLGFTTEGNTVTVVPKDRSAAPSAGRSASSGGADSGSAAVEATGKDAESSLHSERFVEEVVVTGTHIRGEKETAAPSTSITRADIDNAGFTSAQQLFASLPQNFNELSPTGAFGVGTSRIASENTEGASAVSLHGLGADATLTLLNGQRRPGTVNGQVTDVSIIPLSVIDHVDVVYGGNSAIYGSDAVAGVVNIVTRQDYDGADSQVQYSSTQHGGERMQASQIFGLRADRGGFLAAFDYSDQQQLNAVKTGFVVSPSDAGYIPEFLPAIEPQIVKSGYLSGHFDPGDGVELTGHALYSSSQVHSNLEVNVPGVFDFLQQFVTKTDTYSVDLESRFRIAPHWELSIAGNFGAVNSAEPFYSGAVPGPLTAAGFSSNDSRESAVSAVADGDIALPAETDLRAALGIERRAERYSAVNVGDGYVQSDSRHINSAFGELDLSLVKDGPWTALHSLDLSFAARYDDYSDFGRTTNPQLGLVWGVDPGLSVRGSYARSFRAPALFELGTAQGADIQQTADPHSPSGISTVLIQSGGNPNLGPEKADTYTLGIDFQPEFLPQTRLHASYFHVAYSGRIDQPSTSQALSNEAAYASVVNRNPTEAELQTIAQHAFFFSNETGVPLDPTTQSFLTTFPGLVLVDGQFQNVAKEKVEGIDLSFDATKELSLVTLRGGLNGTYFLDFKRQVTATAPPIDEVNTPGQPTKLRLRANVGVTHGPFSAFVYGNYTGPYTDTISAARYPIASWTTFDLTLRFSDPNKLLNKALHGWDVSLSVQNLFDRGPPAFLSNDFGLGYDPANANGFGRVYSARLNKQW